MSGAVPAAGRPVRRTRATLRLIQRPLRRGTGRTGKTEGEGREKKEGGRRKIRYINYRARPLNMKFVRGLKSLPAFSLKGLPARRRSNTLRSKGKGDGNEEMRERGEKKGKGKGGKKNLLLTAATLL